jgi:type I restriction enzyme M protein
MLDKETKRKIDNARDILVGKLPSPQAQVEQITIALIYKFMDDMDKESISFGGNPSFFKAEYEKYGWSKIFDPKLGGYEMLSLYSEAIIKLNQNPHIPQLFRDIFKNAYLPYRDPETLKMFLKEINGFNYDHSEKLGDAFEYLLSVLGSQGDAGQFRTPRHIIDFMVEITQPKKNETICDPACGTAGFLISSYKHILRENSKKNIGDLLTPDDKKKLIENIVGYDISFEMIRLSLVNLYLHGFTSPKIFEYDTLTSEDRWGDSFDIILANPPFMTPKGGIRPHKKFTLKAKRSEVLFVDYILEHINPTTGRAAIIVPEGIIFQSATAYKALRKLLVESNYLYGVVSLPAGIFQPYSGVKTSILLIDKTLAKKTDKLLFVKIENDGYSLGSQRKELTTSDLPDAINFINQYKTAINNNDYSSIDTENLPLNSLIVEKTKIAENGDYNLSCDRYRNNNITKNLKYTHTPLSDLCELIRGVTYSKNDEVESNGNKILRANNIKLDSNSIDFTDIKHISKDILLNERQKLKAKDIFICLASGSADHIGKTAFVDNDLDYYFGGFMGAIRCNENILPEFLFHNIQGERFNNYLNNIITGANIKNLKAEILYSFKIPLPPISTQKEIVDKIEQYEKIIEGAKQVIENYKPFIDINPDWEMVELGKIIKLSSGKGLTQQNFVTGNYPVYGGNGVNGYHNEYFIENPIIVIGRVGAYCGSIQITQSKSWVTDNGLYVTEYLSEINQDYLAQLLTQLDLNKYAKVGGQPSISQTTVYEKQIPVPSLQEQLSIVERLQNERLLVNSNIKLIELFEQKVKDEINKLWEE